MLATTATTAHALSPPDQLPPGTIAQEEQSSKISFHNGRLVWSRYDSGTRQYFLMTRVNGATPAQLPIAPSRVPFDVDLGPDKRRGTVAVYPRCEPGCDIYKYDFAHGKESAVSAVNTNRSETMPSIWGSRIAFARTCSKGKHCGLRVSRVYLARAGAPRSEKRVSPIRMRYRNVPRGESGPLSLVDAIAVELRGKRLAFAVRTRKGENPEYNLLLYLRGKSRFVYRTGLGGAGGHFLGRSLSFDGGTVYTAEIGSAYPSQIVRYRIARRRLETTRERFPGAYSESGDFQVAAGGDRLIVSRGMSVPIKPFVIYETPLPVFQRVRCNVYSCPDRPNRRRVRVRVSRPSPEAATAKVG
jgi:hypothetical protein